MGTYADWTLVALAFFNLVALLIYVYDTNKIAATSKSQLKSFQENSIKQSYETNFFNLMSGYYSLVENIEADIPIVAGHIGKFQGKRCLKQLASDPALRSIPIAKNANETNEQFIARINLVFNPVYDAYSEVFSHYYRFIYNFLNFIDQNPSSDAKKYINILKANLSSFEFELIFLNGLTDNGKKMKALVEKHGFFENWFRDENPKVTYKNLAFLYANGAF